jgi:hypothetical protein
MNIDKLSEIKEAATKALAGRKKLNRIHEAYIKKQHAGGITRKLTTTYNSTASNVMEYEVVPYEDTLKEILNGLSNKAKP